MLFANLENLPSSSIAYNEWPLTRLTRLAPAVTCLSWRQTTATDTMVSNPCCPQLSYFEYVPFLCCSFLAIICKHDVIQKTRIHDVSQLRQSTTEPRAIGNRHKKSDEDRTCSSGDMLVHRQTDTHTHTFNGPFSRTTWVGRYQKGKTKLDFTEARDSEWQWHRLGHMQVCTSFRQITMPAPHYSVFYRLDALPAAQPTASKHWRQLHRQTDIHINKQKYNTDILITTPHSLLAAEQQNTHSLKAFKKSTVCTSNETLTSDKQ